MKIILPRVGDTMASKAYKDKQQKKFNFLNQYYKAKSQDQNASDLVNMYLEEDKDNGKYQVIAYPTPGLTVFNSGSGSVVRGVYTHKNVFYAVVDNKFYSYASNGTRTERGTLNSSTGIVDIASISDQIMIIDGTDGYVYTVSSTTFTTINDADFPANPVSVTAQDEFFLVSDEDSLNIYGSDISAGTSWNALSFASKTGSSDFVSRLKQFKRQIWVFGERNTEVWENTGAPTFSFEPSPSLTFPIGCAAIDSVATSSESIYLLGQTDNGGLRIYKMLTENGYSPTPISNRAIDEQLRSLTTVDDAIAFCYQHSGHEFYVITFPTHAKTWSYDITTGIWNERQSYISAAYTRWIANNHAYCYGKNLVGAYNSGTIYYLDASVYQENGAQILRRIVTPPGYANGKKVYLDKLQVDMQTGVGSSLAVTCELSKDSGATYTTLDSKTIPTQGNRLYWTRLGMTQQAFVIRFSTTVNANVIVLGAQGEFRVGIN
jgi:hypothetical protein